MQKKTHSTNMNAVWLIITILIIFAFIISSLSITAKADEAAYTGEFTFTDEGVTASGDSSGYKISGTALTINEAGTYLITGSCSEGSVKVKKGTTGVTLVLSDLTLTCSTTAPLAVNKDCGQTIITLNGVSTITDNEADETSEDYEGSAIKVKNGSNLLINGDGVLNVNGATKNAIKGASEVDITIAGGTINASAANNALASDGSVTITGGTINILSADDGIKSVPDEDDTASAGKITISGGSVTVNCTSDAIYASNSVDISGGTFDITTCGGYNSTSFDSNSSSAKGIKASSDIEDAEPAITISGGVFSLNTADDAIHSDATVTVTGGTFNIYTGDDGMHGDTTLTLGTEGGSNKDLSVTVSSSYEGLEAGNVYVYSGTYEINSSDDGMNSAGGSSNGSDPGWGGGNSFRPSRPGGGGFNPGGQSSSGDYAIYIYGGKLYVKAGGDGLDSNGPLYLYGGDITVWGAASNSQARDNSPLDADGSILLKGATVFAAGSGQMAETPASGSQNYVKSTSTIASGKGIYVKDSSGNTVYSTNAIEQVNYVLYSSPSLSSGASITAGEAVEEKDTSEETVDDDSSSSDDTKDDGSSSEQNTSEDDELEPVSVLYRTYIQKNGWMSYVSDGTMSGTSGKSLRLEAIQIKLDTDADLGIQYKTYCQTYGWLNWSSNGALNGTRGEAKRLEAIRIKLTGADADKYDIYYRVHAQSYGWLDWAKNGQISGTMGLAKRLEAIQIIVVPKGSEPPTSSYKGIKSTNALAYYKKNS